ARTPKMIPKRTRSLPTNRRSPPAAGTDATSHRRYVATGPWRAWTPPVTDRLRPEPRRRRGCHRAFALTGKSLDHPGGRLHRVPRAASRPGPGTLEVTPDTCGSPSAPRCYAGGETTMRAPLALAAAAVMALGAGTALAQEPLTFASSLGEVAIHTVGHGSLRIEVADLLVHVDPWSNVADYALQPDADLVLVTHTHQDHFDPAELEQVATEGTVFVMDGSSAAEFDGEATALANGETFEFEGITITAVPAYNLVRTRDDGNPYHPMGMFNGYLLDIGDLRVHVAGDTECVPEFADLGEVDVSFLPINLPFTMPPEEAAECYRTIAPAVAVPYHQGDSDPQVVADLLADTDIDVRVLALP